MSDQSERAAAIDASPAINTRCPSCGSYLLFIGSGGHLTCSFVHCKNPSVGDAIERYKALVSTLECLVDNADGYDKSLLHVVREALKAPDFYDRQYLRDELQLLERRGRSQLGNPMSGSRSGSSSTDPAVVATGELAKLSHDHAR